MDGETRTVVKKAKKKSDFRFRLIDIQMSEGSVREIAQLLLKVLGGGYSMHAIDEAAAYFHDEY